IALSAKEIDVAEWKGDILAVGVTRKDMTKDDEQKSSGHGAKRIGFIGLGKSATNTYVFFCNFVVLAEEVTKIASTYIDVFSATILNAEQCKELKMGSYLGNAAASENPPHFIHLCLTWVKLVPRTF
ncbi:LEUCINE AMINOPEPTIDASE-RELATED, partial [Salix viminalis]